MGLKYIMNKQQLSQSLKDILPTYLGEYPAQLVSYIESLYHLSLQKLPVLPNKADVARFHLCTYLAVERCQDRFNLPDPLQQRIPLQPRHVEKLLDDLQDKVVGGINSPHTTPRKRPYTPVSLPNKRLAQPKVGSPLKKLQALAEESTEAKISELRNADSPFNPIEKKGLNPKSPFRTPRKSPSKSGLSSPTAASPGTPRYIRHLTIADFISFANNFYIPASITPQIVECFTAEKHKKNEWLLACGLIYVAYVRINHKLLDSTIGKKTELQDQLFQYQKGGLMKWNMVMWLNIIEESVRGEPWVVDLELKYVHNDWSVEDTSREREVQAKLGRGWELYESLGSMITPSVMFDKPSQESYYNTWTSRLLEKLSA